MRKNHNSDYMEDISSSSKKPVFSIKMGESVNAYGSFIYNHLANVIKVIAYIVAVANLIFGFVVAAFVFRLKLTYIAISFFSILLFAIIAAVMFFVIYGIGHSIEQNNEILSKLS